MMHYTHLHVFPAELAQGPPAVVAEAVGLGGELAHVAVAKAQVGAVGEQDALEDGAPEKGVGWGLKKSVSNF